MINIFFYIGVATLFIYIVSLIVIMPNNLFVKYVNGIAWYTFFISAIIFIYSYSSSIWITILSIPALYLGQFILQIIIGSMKYQLKQK